MSKPFSVIFKSALILSFACSTIPAFAQHGGGGGGGGSHGGGGGGGFHGGGGAGGGFHGGAVGGGFRGGTSAPPMAGAGAPGFAAPRSVAPSPMRSGGGFVSRPGNNYSPPSRNFAGGNQRGGNFESAPPAVSDGRWHSFGGQTGGGRTAGGTAPSESGSPTNGGWHIVSGNHGTWSTGPARSFSGQGREVWENPATARNVVPRSQSLSTLHNSLSGSLVANSGLRPTGSLRGTSRIAGGSASVSNQRFLGGANTAGIIQHQRGFDRVRSPFGFGRGKGCWNCGFGGWGGWGWGNRWGWGGGWGFGWGWPWFGFYGWDPFWFDPWWGWPSAGYGYSGYGYYGPVNNYNIYNYPDSGNYAPNDNSNPPPQEEDQYNQDGNSNGNWVTPNGPSPAVAPDSANLTVPVLIYMKNGAVYSVRDYWMTSEEFYYVLGDGSQHSISLDQVDLPRTNTENAKSGVNFILKSDPSIIVPAPDGSAPPPVQPNSDKPNAIRQPDART